MLKFFGFFRLWFWLLSIKIENSKNRIVDRLHRSVCLANGVARAKSKLRVEFKNG